MGPAGKRGRVRWERASWCCSQIVARGILPPKARQRAVYLGNVGSLQRHADGNPEENGFGIPPHDGPGRQSGRGLDFYCNKFGLQEVRRMDNEQGRYTLVFLAAPGDVERARSVQAPV